MEYQQVDLVAVVTLHADWMGMHAFVVAFWDSVVVARVMHAFVEGLHALAVTVAVV